MKVPYQQVFRFARRGISWLLGLFAVVIVVAGLCRTNEYSKFYDMKPDIIVAHSKIGICWWSVSEEMPDATSYNLHILGG